MKKVKMEDLYCKLYIASNLEKNELLKFIAEIIDGDISIRTVESKTLEVSVIVNEDYDENQSYKDDDFLHYPYYCEIDPVEKINPSLYKMTISKLVTSLRKREMRTIVACDFEDDLPKFI